MMIGNNTIHNKISWSGVRKFLLRLLTLILVICVATATAITVKTLTMSPREQIKARLMRQIERYGWDPYSSNMTIDEFYALMELFDEGKLPLKQKSDAPAATDADGNGESNSTHQTLIIPRDRFLLAGLPAELASEDMIIDEENGTETEILDKPLFYDRDYRYEPYDPDTGTAYKLGENNKGENKDGDVFIFTNERGEKIQLTLRTENEDTTLYKYGRLYSEKAVDYEHFDHGFTKNGNNNVVYEMEERTETNADGEKVVTYGKLLVLGTEEEYVCLFNKIDVNWDDYDKNSGKNPEFKVTDETYIYDGGTLYKYDVATGKGEAYNAPGGQLCLFEKDGSIYLVQQQSGGTHRLTLFDTEEWGDTGILFVDLFTSFTGVEYELRSDGKLYRTGTENDMPFREPAGEYYRREIEGVYQAYEWRDGVMYMPRTNIVANADPIIKNLSYRYPEGYGLQYSGYLRPPKDWVGVKVEEVGDVQTVLVKKGINDNNYQISCDVDQSVFQGDEKGNGDYEHGILYNGYYIKQITIDGANVNILGIIRVPETGRLVYYYLSAEEQDWQVSTTTLRDEDKFLIEYTPNEYKIEYQVLMEGTFVHGDDLTSAEFRSKSIANLVPQNVVMYGATSATTLNWVDSIFGTSSNRAARTTGGAYSFDVLVPYGYEIQIYISVDRIITGTYKDENNNDIPDKAKEPNADGAIPYTFHVDIDHTSSRASVEETWLNGYRKYLVENGIIDSATDFEYVRTPSAGFGEYVTYKWADESDPNAEVHNGVFQIMSERINDMQMHNSARSYYDNDGNYHDNSQTGFPLGKEPEYSYYSGDGFNVFADEKGPASLTMNDTFYNHYVRANRLITAVLKPRKANETPMFDVSNILSNSSGAKDRGSSATEKFALQSIQSYTKLQDFSGDYYDADYLWHSESDHGGLTEHPIDYHHSTYANIDNVGGWGWPSADEKNTFAGHSMQMKPSERGGTYYYSYVFQTNGGGGPYTLDALEVNGIPVYVPYYPKYRYDNGGQTAEEVKRPYFTETKLQDGSTFTVEYLMLFGGSNQRVYRFTVTGARQNVTVTGLNLMTGNGAPEFSVYSLSGVYAGVGDQTDLGIQFYHVNGYWATGYQSNVVVTSDNSGIRTAGDKDMYGANLRFKIADGYGSPYYTWVDIKDEPINNQTSLPYKEDENGNQTLDIGNPNRIVNWSEVKQNPSEWTDEKGYLKSQYIYYMDDSNNDDYGYYYIHVAQPGELPDSRICLLTIVAKTAKYTVRYTASHDPEDPHIVASESNKAWYGFIQDPATGQLVVEVDSGLELQYMRFNQEAPNGKNFLLDTSNTSLPTIIHDRSTCELVGMIDSDALEEWIDVIHQYDDNGGAFYDMIYNTRASIMSNEYGTIRPKDKNNGYNFVAWVLVDENFLPYGWENGEYIYFTSGVIDLKVYGEYAVKHSAFGNDETDIMVFRLMPVWTPNNNPYSYSVVLNWVDAKGTLSQVEFSDWDDVTTEAQIGDQLFVFLNKDSIPLQNWIASHPTYVFWDAVNNATTQFIRDDNGNLILDEDGNPQRDRTTNTTILKEALEDYLQRTYNPAVYPQDAMILQALVNRDYSGYNDAGVLTEPSKWVEHTDGNTFYLTDPVTNKHVQNEDGKEIKVPWEYVQGGNGVDDFDRLDGSIFRVNENGGTISIWMYETKGGLLFKKSVEVEPFTGDDEFYFSVINNWVGEKTTDKDGNVITPTALLGTEAEPAVYKAYPLTYYNEKLGTWGIYDENGKFVPATDELSMLVTFIDGEIVSIEQNGKLLTEKNSDGYEILGEDGKPIPVTYFTLTSGEGISLYVPNGNYTIVETGSKSGGAYQAEVDYTGASKFEENIELPTGELWMKGKNKHYIPLGEGETFDDEKYTGVSQIPVTITFLTGQEEIIQTLTFYNRTNSLSVGMSLDQGVYKTLAPGATQNEIENWNKLYKGDYNFIVVFALPTGQTPLVKAQSALARSATAYAAGEEYFFNMNIYDGFNDNREFVEMREVIFEKYDADRHGNPWDIVLDNYDNLWIGKFTLLPEQSAALVMQVMTGNVNYWVDEPVEEDDSLLPNDLEPKWQNNRRRGEAVVGYKNSVFVTNYWHDEVPEDPEVADYGYLKITVFGGKSGESFLFRITNADNRESVIVSVKGNGGSTYVYMPLGEYSIEEISGWSWRYDGVISKTSAKIADTNNRNNPYDITFDASPNGKGWLGGETNKEWLT